MSKERYAILTNTNKASITNSDDAYIIKGIPITVNGAIMNEVLYRDDENSKGMPSLNKKPIVASHPADENGINVSVFTPEGIDYYIGSKSKQPYLIGNTWHTDVDVNKKKLLASTNGDYFADRLDKGLPIGVSTGLLFEANNESGEGYKMVAKNIEFDHLAFLHESETPAGGDATVMRFNGEQIKTFNFDDFKPLTTEQEDSFFKRIVNRLMPKVDEHITKRYNEQDTNINVNDNEVPEMELKEVEQLLQVNNETQNKALADIVATAVNSAVEPLKAEIDLVKQSVTANADKEKAELVTKVNALEIGLPDSAIKAMNADELKGLLAKHSGAPAGGVNTNSSHSQPEASDDYDMPE